VLSFHATKLFHTAEGGALVVRHPKLKHRIDLLKNFGIKNEEGVVLPGINGKMTELQAAMGLAVLSDVDAESEAREAVAQVYRGRLAADPGLSCVDPPPSVRNSYQYFIIRVQADVALKSRDQTQTQMRATIRRCTR
jgi:dTDP-4-amino-4,6-dideoxygalactose transaminase